MLSIYILINNDIVIVSVKGYLLEYIVSVHFDQHGFKFNVQSYIMLMVHYIMQYSDEDDGAASKEKK